MKQVMRLSVLKFSVLLGLTIVLASCGSERRTTNLSQNTTGIPGAGTPFGTGAPCLNGGYIVPGTNICQFAIPIAGFDSGHQIYWPAEVPRVWVDDPSRMYSPLYLGRLSQVDQIYIQGSARLGNANAFSCPGGDGSKPIAISDGSVAKVAPTNVLVNVGNGGIGNIFVDVYAGFHGEAAGEDADCYVSDTGITIYHVYCIDPFGSRISCPAP